LISIDIYSYIQIYKDILLTYKNIDIYIYIFIDID
jgi:hypothetical protein